MPHVDITMFPGRDDEIKTVLAANVRKCVIDTLGVPPEVVSVSVEDVQKADWQSNVAKYADTMFIEPNSKN